VTAAAYPVGEMTLPLPSTLTPSKIASFKDCALAFRFSVIDKLPEPPTPWTFRGTLVHKALEGLFSSVPRGNRTSDAALSQLEHAWLEAQQGEELAALDLGPGDLDELLSHAASLVTRYFELEDPNSVSTVGVEMPLEARLGPIHVRGIIDRLDEEGGDLVVTDYKTGRAPGEASEQARLAGVHFYAFLCEQALGRRPARVQLLYLSEPMAIVAMPSEQSMRGLRRRSRAVWTAIERACRTGDFRPKPSRLCEHCHYRPYCPAFGGDPDLARAELADPARLALQGGS
jgi:putative RecB family exonuclease